MKSRFDADVLRDAAAAPLRRMLGWALLCAVLAGMSSVLLLALSGWFLTVAALAGAAGTVTAMAFNYLIPSAAIRGLAIIRTLSRYGERLLAHQAALQAIAELRGTLFARLAGLDSRSAPNLSSGEASARLLGDIEALEDLVIRRPARPASLLSALFAVALTALAGWQAACAFLLLLLALPLLLHKAAEHLTRVPATESAEALGDLRRAVVDYMAAQPEIIAYGATERAVRALQAIAMQLDQARARLFRGEAMLAGFLAAYAALAAVLVLALAEGAAAMVALAILAATAGVEAMAAFARTAFRQASVEQSLQRLAVLNGLQAPEQHEASGRSVDRAAASLVIGGTRLAPGSRVAVIGPSGSGKTWLLEAFAGWRMPVHDLALNDLPVDKVSAGLLQQQCALSPQDAPLITGSIADNLRLARPGLTETEMMDALRVVCLDSRVQSFPDGLERFLRDGEGLSGGERKRLSLARALLAGRPWLLLDEPTEGLDVATEAQVIANLAAWLDATGTGLLLVSHRKPPLRLAKQSIAMADLPRFVTISED